MNMRNKTSRWISVKRWVRYKYLQLLRAKGGPDMVAKGFAIGLAVEMFTLPTLGLASLLILPLSYIFRASIPGAIIGLLFGKIIYIPMSFLTYKVGRWIIPNGLLKGLHPHTHFFHVVLRFFQSALEMIVGGIIVGAIFGLLFYFLMKKLLEIYATKRAERRKQRWEGRSK